MRSILLNPILWQRHKHEKHLESDSKQLALLLLDLNHYSLNKGPHRAFSVIIVPFG